jgi:hypothetical protein
MENNLSETFIHIAKKYIPKTYKKYFENDNINISQVIKDLLNPEKLAFYVVNVVNTNIEYNIESTTICQVMYEKIRNQFQTEFPEFLERIEEFQTELPGFLDRIEEDYYHLIHFIQKTLKESSDLVKQDIHIETYKTNQCISTGIRQFLNDHEYDYLPESKSILNQDDYYWEFSSLDGQFDCFNIILPNFPEISDENVNKDELLKEYIYLSELLCKEMDNNFKKKRNIEKLKKQEKIRKKEFVCENFVRYIPKDILHYISEFFGREDIYRISFVDKSINLLYKIEQNYNHASLYLKNFVENQIKNVSFEFLKKTMNSEYLTIDNAINYISESIVNPSRSQQFFSGKVLYVKIQHIQSKYKKWCEIKNKNIKSRSTKGICVDCKVQKPVTELVSRHKNKDNLFVIDKRCFDCNSVIAKNFYLSIPNKSYCFIPQGSILRY